MNTKADCVLVLSFGLATKKTETDVNKLLADVASTFSLPTLAQNEVAIYLNSPTVLKNKNGYFDTWSVLKKAKYEMKNKSFKNAVLVTHNAHIKRTAKQAKKLGISFVISEALPSKWDKYSKQWWTRSRTFWKIHEMVTVTFLKLTGKM